MDLPSTRLPLRCFVLYLSFALLATASDPTPCFAEGYPSHAIDPVIVEYDADPAWPNRPDTVAPFGWVSGMAIDRHNQVWIFNRGEDPVQVYTTDGEFVRTWGKGNFSNPHQIRIGPDGNVWVADFGLHIVQKYTPEGELLMTLGVRGEKGDDQTHFNMPTDMAITPAGDIFVTDGYGNRRVVHFDKDGRFIKSWGGYGTGPGQFVLPHAIVVDSDGLLYVADRNSGRIQVFDQDGTHRDTWANLIMPWGLSVTDGDEIWVCGSSSHWWVRDGHAPEYKDQMLIRFDKNGAAQQIWSLPLGDIGPDKNNPDTSHLKYGETVGVHCIVQDSEGNLYVGDIYGQRAQKLIPITSRPASDEQPQAEPQ
jgi:6-bladed beta-propeller protein